MWPRPTLLLSVLLPVGSRYLPRFPRHEACGESWPTVARMSDPRVLGAAHSHTRAASALLSCEPAQGTPSHGAGRRQSRGAGSQALGQGRGAASSSENICPWKVSVSPPVDLDRGSWRQLSKWGGFCAVCVFAAQSLRSGCPASREAFDT